MKEQNLHNKKFREIINSMFNLKMFCLMKKHVFSLLMAFALVLGLSAGAWAQATTVPAAADQEVGSTGNPKVYITGATDSLQITRGVLGGNSTVQWILYTGSAAVPGNEATSTDLDLVAHPTWDATQDNAVGQAARFRFKWTDNAAGAYYLQVTETDQRTQASPLQDRTCAVTVRGFHIFIMGFDVAIYASNNTGDSLNADLLSACAGPAYPAFLNDVVMNVDGTIRTDILNTVPNPAVNGPDLTPIVGTTAHADRSRWYTVKLRFDTPPGDNFTPLTVGSIRMKLRVNGVDSLYVATINGVDMEGDRASYSNADAFVALNGAQADYEYPFEVIFNDIWGADLEPTVTVTDVTLWSGNDGAGLNLGEEPSTYEDLVPNNPARFDNTSNAFTIFGKPATGPISVH